MGKQVSKRNAVPPDDGVKVKGSYRLQIQDQDGEITGDSGWYENLITNVGFQWYLCGNLGSVASSSMQVGFVAIGTGGLATTTDTNLSGEIMAGTKRAGTTNTISSTSKSIQFTGTFNSTNSFLTASSNISNIGLFASSSAGYLFAGNTYASSTCATNQNVNVSYTITFA